VKTGLESFERSWPGHLKGTRVGLVVHPASIDKNLVHAVDHFLNTRVCRLSALFGPQHGIRGETQDNMIEWRGFRDRRTGLRVFSLYGSTRKPTKRMLREVDVLVIDLQDIGARYYTYIWTMYLCMETSNESGKAVVILDRPNPITGKHIEGPVLDEEFSSFVGLRPLPVRHGMTIGEIGLYFYKNYFPSLDFHIIKMNGWYKDQWFDDTGLPWIMPSPNIPTLESATVYPGMCLIEGTNISEGRGTTRPFEIFGAPFIDPDRLVSRLSSFRLSGVRFRPLYFKPTFNKYAGKVCGGAQIHVTDRERFRPFKTGATIIKAIHDLYPDRFRWRTPPYEYESKKLPIDILTGSDKLRLQIEKGTSLKEMEDWWRHECYIFNKKIREKYLIYE